MPELTYKDIRRAVRMVKKNVCPRPYYHGILPDGTYGTVSKEKFWQMMSEELRKVKNMKKQLEKIRDELVKQLREEQKKAINLKDGSSEPYCVGLASGFDESAGMVEFYLNELISNM